MGAASPSGFQEWRCKSVPVARLPNQLKILYGAEGLRMSSQARILVDNLAVTHGRSGRTPRTLSLAELEDWLAAKAIVWGSERMLRLPRRGGRLGPVNGHG